MNRWEHIVGTHLNAGCCRPFACYLDQQHDYLVSAHGRTITICKLAQPYASNKALLMFRVFETIAHECIIRDVPDLINLVDHIKQLAVVEEWLTLQITLQDCIRSTVNHEVFPPGCGLTLLLLEPLLEALLVLCKSLLGLVEA